LFALFITEAGAQPLGAGLRHDADGLPRARAQRVDSAVWVDAGVAAADGDHAFESPPAPGRLATAGEGRGCEASLRLPWGPITRCSQAVVAGAVGATAAVSLLAWWSQGFSSDFSVADEGWFGPNTYSGGIDKLGHAYSFYLGTRLGTRALGWAQVPHDDALRLAAGVGLGVGLGIEVLDGLSRSGQYGFSWEDLTMNAIGIGAGVLMESHPELDRRFAFRWMYSAGGSQWYDHHTYLVAFRLSGLASIGRNNPLRYLELVAGYGAKGFRSDFDFSAGDTRRRSIYLGVALNLSEVLFGSGRAHGREGRAQRVAEEALRYVQVPGTAVAKAWHRHP
jgi:hypothetical protein